MKNLIAGIVFPGMVFCYLKGRKIKKGTPRFVHFLRSSKTVLQGSGMPGDPQVQQTGGYDPQTNTNWQAMNTLEQGESLGLLVHTSNYS